LRSHQPFETVQKAIEDNLDIISSTNVFEKMSDRLYFEDTDEGQEMLAEIRDLSDLLDAYRMGYLKEGVRRHKGM
jgi:fructose-1,6-bisphosphatase-3